MIAYIRGKLVEAGALTVIIEVNGLGYEVSIPVTTMERLPVLGKEVKLYTYPVYRDDSQALFGFLLREDRDFFGVLVDKVSGIGPKIALSIMSKLSVPVLKTAIASGDVALLAKCKGIGKKTAERLVVELRDQFSPSLSAGTGLSLGSDAAIDLPVSKIQDAVAALMVLGYRATDADKAVRKAMGRLGQDATTEEVIRASLN